MINTARLRLEPVSTGAAGQLAYGGDGGWTWLGGGPEEGTRGMAGIVARAAEVGWHRPPWGLYVVVHPADGLAIGSVGFHGPPDPGGCVEIGYDLVPAARGFGLATEGVKALTAFAFTHPAVRSVLAVTRPDNTRSQRVLLRAGFVRGPDQEGLRRYRVDR
ncbi:GNAT family N-acetyltransferase [Streptacidiphilus sp. N1-3]|uniref:GNAT family N-acetyltransferase n=1 Tax=Streptacidiphilus alkalitolerans TaxID=3342712 RepID=A0ABV6WTK6_9ACTN